VQVILLQRCTDRRLRATSRPESDYDTTRPILCMYTVFRKKTPTHFFCHISMSDE